MKKYLKHLLILMAIIAICTICNPTKAQAASESYALGETSIYYGRQQLTKMPNSTALLYAYDQIAAGVANSAQKISVYNGTNAITRNELQVVFDLYQRDYAHHFWLGKGYSYSYNNTTCLSVIPSYTMTGTQLQAAKEDFDQAANTILAGVTLQMSEYERELYLHDALADVITYSEGANAHDAYGALVEGRAVCEGYAEALQYLLQRAGIQSFLVIGYGVNQNGAKQGHEWNYVRIDGKYYHVDLTWDDQEDKLFHSYFNQTDAVMQEDHLVTATDYALPICNSIDAHYFTGKDTYLNTYTAATVGKLLKNNQMSVHVYIPGDVNAFLNWWMDNIRDIARNANVTGGFSYGYTHLGREAVLSIKYSCNHVNTATTTKEKVITPATCTTAGSKTVFTICACGEVISEKTVAIAAQGHITVIIPGKKPTATETGLTEGKKCSVCGKILVAQEIIPTEMVSVSIKTIPTKATYYIGDSLNTSGLKLLATFGDGTTKTITSGFSVSGFNSTTAGSKTVKVSYEGFTDTFVVTVKTPSITLSSSSNTMLVGDTSTLTATTTPSGQTVTWTSSNTSVATVSGGTIVAKASGSATITAQFTYNGKTYSKTCSVTVKNAPVPTSLSVSGTPAKTTYKIGEGLNTSGLKLKLTYSDGSTETITGGFSTSGFDSTTAGIKMVTVKYGNLTTTFIVTVIHTHNYASSVTKKPSCTATGLKTYTCSSCGDSYTETVSATGHNWESATCEEPKTCTKCGITSGYALGHYYNIRTTKNPTCTENGTKTYTCMDCGDAYTQNIPALGHDYDSGKVTKKATCNATGVKTYTCSVCNGTKTETIAKLTTHTYSNNCDRTCNVCGVTRTITHAYSNNCDKSCNVCGATRTINHTYTNSCDTSCNVCGAIRTITHAYTTTTTKATLSANGSIVKKCTICGKMASTTIKYAKTFTLSATNYTYNGSVKTPTVTVKDSAGKTLTKNTDYTITYASGRKNVGTYTVKVTMKGNYTGTKTLSFKINPVQVALCSVNLSATNYTYNGTTKTPTVTVKSPGGSKLTKGTSYTVSYASGRVNAGTYTVKVTMKGNYTGTKTLTFKINPVQVALCSVNLSATSYTYNGSVKTPTVTVKSPGGSKLTKGTSYTVSYASGRKNVGTYKVTITMKGNYTGTKTLTFKINPAATTVSKLTAGSKSITVGITKKSTQVTGYQIQYSTSKSFSSATTKTISSYNTTSYALKGLSAQKTYYVRVRTYKTVNSTKYYSGWSAYKYVKTK